MNEAGVITCASCGATGPDVPVGVPPGWNWLFVGGGRHGDLS